MKHAEQRTGASGDQHVDGQIPKPPGPPSPKPPPAPPA